MVEKVMPRQPSRRDIAEQDRYQLRRQQSFRAAADAVAEQFINFPTVERVALFGSVAGPLTREVPRFEPYRRSGIGVLHESKDVDLAVWLTSLNGLRELGLARSKAASVVTDALGAGVAHHQVDVFLFDFEGGAYLGRLCTFATCPKGKPECRVPGCGATLFLRQHDDFRFNHGALSNAVILFDRQGGIRCQASNLPTQCA